MQPVTAAIRAVGSLVTRRLSIRAVISALRSTADTLGVVLFLCLPLKIRGGSGSPVRAVALLEDAE